MPEFWTDEFLYLQATQISVPFRGPSLKTMVLGAVEIFILHCTDREFQLFRVRNWLKIRFLSDIVSKIESFG